MTEEVKTYTADEVAAMIEEKTSGLKAKVDELLGESKSAKAKARELEELKNKQEEEGLRQREEFKTLYEREQAAKKELAEKYEQTTKRVQLKEIDAAASSVAGELTRDTKRAELLKKEVAQYARYTDDGVIFEMGGVQVDRAKVVEHIESSYPFLIDGKGSTGGGATGAVKSGGAVTMTRSDFDNLAPFAKSEFIRKGGKIT